MLSDPQFSGEEGTSRAWSIGWFAPVSTNPSI